MQNKVLDQLLHSNLGLLYSGATIAITKDEKLVYQKAYGVTDPREQLCVTRSTLFDIASLTKPFIATLTIILARDKVLALHDRLSTILPWLKQPDKENISFYDVLTHSAGFAPTPVPSLYASSIWKNSPEEIIKHLCEIDLLYKPTTKIVYSCVGFMILGYALEKLIGVPLDQLLKDKLTLPLKIDHGVMYNPRKVRGRIATTDKSRPKRGVLPPGVVHDGNAFALGGVSGNAGLFANVDALTKFGSLFLNNELTSNLGLTCETITYMTKERKRYAEDRVGIGWQLLPRSINAASGDQLLSKETFGHTGFTGTFLRIDPKSKLIICFLSNAVYFSHYMDSATTKRLYLENLSEFRRNIYSTLPTFLIGC